MCAVMTDFYLVEGMSQMQNISMDSPEKTDLYRSVMAKHHITLKDYDHSLEWYSSHLKEYKQLNYQVEDRLTSIQDSIDGREHKVKKYDDD